MPYERPGRGVDLTANAQLTHDKPHYQDGMVGVPQKQDNPKSLDSLASRTLIASGVKYFLRLKGVCQVKQADHAGLAGATIGAAVYIATANDALVLTDTAGTLPFGRIVSLSGQHGTPTGFVRINMDLKDNVPNPL
jgi:hypothetical protein